MPRTGRLCRCAGSVQRVTSDHGDTLPFGGGANYRLVDPNGNLLGRRRFLNFIEATHWAIRTWRASGADVVSLQTEALDGQIISRLAVGPFTATNVI